jgi:hypothetical protein
VVWDGISLAPPIIWPRARVRSNRLAREMIALDAR